MNLWLDDRRKPPPGWTWAKTARDAMRLLLAETVEEASLDHDLWQAPCERCVSNAVPIHEDGFTEPVSLGCPPCPCPCHALHLHPSGFDLVCSMANLGAWPRKRPVVHSRNTAAKEQMEAVIAQFWRAP